MLEERDLSRGGGLFSGIKYHYQDSLCIRKEYLGNPKINRNDFFFYKGNKLIKSLQTEDGPWKIITDYQYNEKGLEVHVSLCEYENGILASENITQLTYDEKDREILGTVKNNGEISAEKFTYYDSIYQKPSSVDFSKRLGFSETYINFDSTRRREHQLSIYYGGTLLEEVNMYNDKYLLISRTSMSGGTVNHREVFAYDSLGQLTRHEESDKHDRKLVYIFKDRMPVAEQTWYNGKLYSTVNYTYNPIVKKRR